MRTAGDAFGMATSRSGAASSTKLGQHPRRSSSRQFARYFATLALSALIVGPVLAMEPEHEPLRFAPVPGVGASVGAARVFHDDENARPSLSSLPPIARATRPIVRVPEAPVIVVKIGSQSGVVAGRGHSVAGVASWFCGHGSPCTRGYARGLYAAAGPSLRVGDWRGRLVIVSGNGHSVGVRLIDCNCGPNANLIDLYTDAFSRLAPLSRGVLNVTVSW